MVAYDSPDCPWYPTRTAGVEECGGECGYINSFGLTQYDCKDSFFGSDHPLSQAWGYAIVVGFGIFFSIVTSIIIYLDHHYGGSPDTSEEFNTAGRSLKTGLVACHVVSQWTWAATLLQSSNVAYQYGVTGPFWYASGATIQILLFGILAVQIKRKAPSAHTVGEIILARWGKTVHMVFLVFLFATNVIVTSMLLLGGSAVMSALTGMNVYAAAFLIPLGVATYTFHGGLKATVLAAYIHTAFIFVVLCIFVYQVYVTNSLLGSPATVWEHLTLIASPGYFPVPDNKQGSYMTMFSKGGFIFGIINVVGNFGTVFVDQTYWQGAIAAKPSSSYKGYILGGLLWFTIPFALATALGLGSRALDIPINPSEAGQGLVPPATATVLLGKGGAVLIVIMLFMAVTSAGSAEMIAVSSLCAYDVYRTYINPEAKGKQIIWASRITIAVYAVLMGVFATILNELGVSLGWVYLMMGIVIGSAVIPIYLCLTWSKTSGTGAILGAFIGQWAAVITWLVYAKVGYGAINLATTGKDYPMLAGNLVAILLSGFICITYSLIFPQNYDWKSMREIPNIEQDGTDELPEIGEDSPEAMDKAYTIMLWVGGGLSILLVVLWPLLTLPAGVFSKGYFTFWVSISIAWGTLASIIAILLPLWEARAALFSVATHVATCAPSQAPPPKVVEEKVEKPSEV